MILKCTGPFRVSRFSLNVCLLEQMPVSIWLTLFSSLILHQLFINDTVSVQLSLASNVRFSFLSLISPEVTSVHQFAQFNLVLNQAFAFFFFCDGVSVCMTDRLACDSLASASLILQVTANLPDQILILFYFEALKNAYHHQFFIFLVNLAYGGNGEY